MHLFAHTKSLAKEFSEILTFEYFGYLKIGFDVFFNINSESPYMTWGKNATLKSYGQKTNFGVVT